MPPQLWTCAPLQSVTRYACCRSPFGTHNKKARHLVARTDQAVACGCGCRLGGNPVRPPVRCGRYPPVRITLPLMTSSSLQIFGGPMLHPVDLMKSDLLSEILLV